MVNKSHTSTASPLKIKDKNIIKSPQATKTFINFQEINEKDSLDEEVDNLQDEKFELKLKFTSSIPTSPN